MVFPSIFHSSAPGVRTPWTCETALSQKKNIWKRYTVRASVLQWNFLFLVLCNIRINLITLNLPWRVVSEYWNLGSLPYDFAPDNRNALCVRFLWIIWIIIIQLMTSQPEWYAELKPMRRFKRPLKPYSSNASTLCYQQFRNHQKETGSEYAEPSAGYLLDRNQEFLAILKMPRVV